MNLKIKSVMFGIGFEELVVIFLVVLVVFGPDKLPELATKAGRIFANLKRGSDAFKREIYQVTKLPSLDMPPELRELKSQLVSVKDQIKQEVSKVKPGNDREST